MSIDSVSETNDFGVLLNPWRFNKSFKKGKVKASLEIRIAQRTDGFFDCALSYNLNGGEFGTSGSSRACWNIDGLAESTPKLALLKAIGDERESIQELFNAVIDKEAMPSVPSGSLNIPQLITLNLL
jgi:hypothetical protein